MSTNATPADSAVNASSDDLATAATTLIEQFPDDAGDGPLPSVDDIVTRLDQMVNGYNVPLEEATRATRNHYPDVLGIEYDDLALPSQSAGDTTLDEINTDGQWVSVTVKVVDDTETYCQQCGLVVARDLLDRELQWTTTKDGERQPARGGAPTTIRRHDKGLPTEIGHFSDGYGSELPSKTQRRFNRLRKWDDRAKADSTHVRSLRTGLGEIAHLVSAIELPSSIHDRAAMLFRDAWEANLLRGRSIEGIATASLFAACRLERLPRFLEEFATVARIDQADIKSAYKLLNRELELATPPPLPKDFLPRLANDVDAHPRVERRAYQLLAAPAVGILANGRQPAGVTAACLYHAHKESEMTNLRLTQQRLADAGNTTPTTIRNVRRELLSLEDAGDLTAPDDNLADYAW